MTKGTVLVIDDDRQMVKTLSAVLALHEWDVVGGHSGEEAVAAVERQPFDAVVMDVRMPGIGGVDAFRAIHRLQPSLPVILMTAYAAQELLAEAEREGAIAVLPKPVALPALTALLDEVSSLRQSVLLVDDDADYLASLADVLRGHGASVLEAGTLAAALALLDGEAPEVVVLGLRLGDAHPANAVLAIKRLSPAVVLILSTSEPDQLTRTLATVPPGMIRASLVKPFQPERLVELLESLRSG